MHIMMSLDFGKNGPRIFELPQLALKCRYFGGKREMETLFQILIVLTGVGGAYFVAKRDTKGFKIFIFSNILLIATSLSHELYGMTLLYVFYTAMCFYSIWSWKKIDAQPVSITEKS
jgi:nicotinamide riboside transporter PnuC